MTEYVLEAELRENTGKAHTRRLRRAGKLPGIIYGGDKPDLPIILDYNETAKIMMRDESFYTSMITVNVKGKRGANTVLLKDTQWDSIYDTPRHVDFYRVSAADKVTVAVPITALNTEECPGIKNGGTLQLIRHELDVLCRADAIPEYIEIDCAAYELDTTVHIDDITLPEGVEVPHDVNFTILNIAAPKRAADPVEDEAVVVESDAPAAE